ncbi:citrate lyase subunit beta [Clostridium novyi A str. 4552]|uniref:Citrate lyase subunit beta n=1 Tax=Clostridium novyi A str. 4552 TaxID=1444289 RepID=A0A0A0I363_CLONO|nr:HpcH/HpaI aldolase/citrate lyase family protein [Clostridium novyi]KGM95093.1 citrate lyase subunit beta [Clostridium novyi A str. 4552]
MKLFDERLIGINKKVFFMEPNEILKTTSKKYLELAIGANLYIPAIKEGIMEIILRKKYKNLNSLTICMEDSIPAEKVAEAEKNVFSILNKLKDYIDSKRIESNILPLIFIRVRNLEQFKKIVNRKEELSILTGIIFPKFNSSNGEKYLDVLKELNKDINNKIYGLPILESKKIIYKESRVEELLKIKKLLDKNKDYILNVRMGATDFQGIYSLRRKSDNSIYDIGIIRDCITDILNMFLRAEQQYVVSGTVWEYFNSKMDGLIKEVNLDKANGIIGKTIIHPTHISIVNSLYVVTKEEYEDAIAIVKSNDTGAYKSAYNNKMNEISPHLNWANKILRRAYVYGVFNENCSYLDLL